MTKGMNTWEEESRKLNTGTKGSKAEKLVKDRTFSDVSNWTFCLKFHFNRGEMEDDIRMIDCTQVMEGPESQANWPRVHPTCNEEPQKGF